MIKEKPGRMYSDSSMAVAILQAGKGRNGHIQACAREIWLSCALHDIILTCRHTPSDSLISTADVLSRCHLGSIYQDRVHEFVRSRVQIKTVPDAMFSLSRDL